MRRIFNISLFLMGLLEISAQSNKVVTLDLENTIRLTTDSSLTAYRNQSEYLSGYWTYRTFKANRLPSLTFNLTPAKYYRYITTRYDSESDKDVYREQQMYNAYGALEMSQNIDLLGGTLYANTSLGYMRNFGLDNSTQYSSVPIQIGYTQSLLGYNAFKWEKLIEPVKYDKVCKELVYNTEKAAEEAVTYFFELAMAQSDYQMALDNVASADSLYSIGKMRHKIASISQADLLTLDLDRVNAANSLVNARIALKRAMFSLSSYLNLDTNSEIVLALPNFPRLLHVEADEALKWAKQNNPTFVEQKQNILEAEQEVAKTRAESRMNVSVDASIGFNQVADNLVDAYHRPLQQDLVSLSLSIPILDWGVKKGKHNVAKNNLDVARTTAKQEFQNVEEEVVMTVSDFNVQSDLIASAERAREIAESAYEQTRMRFVIGKVDVNSISLALSRKQEAKSNYVTALKNYWLSYYKIRRLTLYDFITGNSLLNESRYLNIIK